MDPELEVIGYSEDPEVVPVKHLFRLFELTDLTPMQGTKSRTTDGVPTISFGKEEHSVQMVALEITSTF